MPQLQPAGEPKMSVYPAKVQNLISAKSAAASLGDADAQGTAASFDCGSYVSFSMKIEKSDGVIESAWYQTNACGFAIAAAEVLCRHLRSKRLMDLGGIRDEEITRKLAAELGASPDGRKHCIRLATEAVRRAAATYRRSLLDEYTGEKALICTCFGIDEETLVEAIRTCHLTEVRAVTDTCRAGGGCGSCLPLIQELLDVESVKVRGMI